MDLTGVRTYTDLDQLVNDPDDRSDRYLPAPAPACRGDGRGLGRRQARAVRKTDRARFALRRQDDARPPKPPAGNCWSLKCCRSWASLPPPTADRRRQYGRLLGGYFKRIISEPKWIPDFFDPAARRRTDGRSAHPRRPFHPPDLRHAAGRFYDRPLAGRAWPSCSPRSSCSTIPGWPSPPPAE